MFCNNKINIAILGIPESGKSSYIQLALQYYLLKQKQSEFNTKDPIHTMCEDDNTSNVLNDANVKMKEGIFPDKTFGINQLHVRVRFSFCQWLYKIIYTDYSLIFHDLMGEYMDTIINKQSIPDELSDCLSKTKLYVIMVDPKWIIPNNNNDATYISFRKILAAINNVNKKINVAIVLTKSDTIHNNDNLSTNEKPDLNKITNKLIESLGNEIGKIRYPNSNVKVEFFTVTCLSNKNHITFSPEKGSIPNSDWDINDMKEQLDPLRWIFDRLPTLKGLWR